MGMVQKRREGQIPTRTGLSTGVLRVSREVVEEVVGELDVGQLGHLEETTGNVGDLIVGGIKVCQTVCGEREKKREVSGE